MSLPPSEYTLVPYTQLQDFVERAGRTVGMRDEFHAHTQKVG